MRLALLVLLGALALTACGGGTSAPSGPQTIRVPADHATIQDAVDAAQRGDIVLVAPGEYRESVHIKKEGITLRGEDRNTVILDGEDQRQNGVYVTVGGVAVVATRVPAALYALTVTPPTPTSVAVTPVPAVKAPTPTAPFEL